eukprot:TRINITY_DN722_c0_g1_i1.p1 TRINITY_DN722_c0_g1~~TRINITY_DN722_c0_g1_i1.p1  ORF type:complete len:514 (+),score=76.86 TRINITY_DN722_c0_g1_i1:799-2340(+)
MKPAIIICLLVCNLIVANSQGVTPVTDENLDGECTLVYDAIIIGCGASGVSAANYLKQYNKSVLVLEARNRCGGRTYTETVKLDRPTKDGKTSVSLDFGGMWLGHRQDNLAKVASELGIKYYPTFVEGININYLHGERSEYTGLIPSGIGILGLLETDYWLKQFTVMAQEMDVNKPWNWSKAKEFDSETLESYIQKHGWTSGAKTLLEIAVRMIYGVEPNEISALYFLYYIRSAGSFEELCSADNGAQQWLFEGGAQQISEKLANKLGPDVVLKSHPVSKIEYNVEESNNCGGNVVVHSNGKIFRSKKAILAMSPKMCQHIQYSPPLPGTRNQFHQRMPMGSTIKVHVVYERFWWREKGYSGQIVSDIGPIAFTADEGYPTEYKKQDDSAPDMLPTIVGFIIGKYATEWGSISVEDRKKAVIDQLASMFQDEEARNFLAYAEYDWRADEYSGGCYVGVMAPGALTRYGSIMREPVGPLHWAGTELATSWAGYIDGAIQSGERAASEVVSQLFP